MLLQRFYESKILEVCSALRPSLPSKVKGAALNFFKRFMLTTGPQELDNKARDTGSCDFYSVSCYSPPRNADGRPPKRPRRRDSQIHRGDHCAADLSSGAARALPMPPPPQAAMLTCVYLACKVEEAYVSAEDLARVFQQSESLLLNTERQILQGLNFHASPPSPSPVPHMFCLCRELRRRARIRSVTWVAPPARSHTHLIAVAFSRQRLFPSAARPPRVRAARDL